MKFRETYSKNNILNNSRKYKIIKNIKSKIFVVFALRICMYRIQICYKKHLHLIDIALFKLSELTMLN